MQFHVVVSSENTQYMAWQTQLFCYSVLTRIGQRPTVIVHETTEPLRREFEILGHVGCHVIQVPACRCHPTGDYPARNELGSLLATGSIPSLSAGHILFCEPDMLFTGAPCYQADLAGEYYPYLNYAEERIMYVAGRFGIDARIAELNQRNKIGVPYLIPAREVGRIARRWIEVLDTFRTLEWIDIMYAFGLALAIEGLEAETTHIMNHNGRPMSMVNRPVVHYCYGDRTWDKRHFVDKSPLDAIDEMASRPPEGTIQGEIFTQISQAHAYFRDLAHSEAPDSSSSFSREATSNV